MGDRALVVFMDPDTNELSPVTYLHWSGSAVPELIESLRTFMAGREGDLSYTAARFVGLCHDRLKGSNTSLGIYPPPAPLQSLLFFTNPLKWDDLVAAHKRSVWGAELDGPSKEYMDQIDKFTSIAIDESHGDAGFIIVCCNTAKNGEQFLPWISFGGYLDRHGGAQDEAAA